MRQFLIVVICSAIGFASSIFFLPRKSEVRYNCELAEISPDFPVEVRKQCRELKAKQ